MRAVVSYDDIVPPPSVIHPDHLQESTGYNDGNPNPSKKRRWRKSNNSNQPAVTSKAAKEHSWLTNHELTHEEIWDDSALIEAWDTANEEYATLNGDEKKWKTEPKNRSPLWYNTPPTAPQPPETGSSSEGDPEASYDFDTFQPSHDPQLLGEEVLTNGAEYDEVNKTDIPAHLVSKDEAFQRALQAQYWAGYWTAMYHAADARLSSNIAKEAADSSDDEIGEQDGDHLVATDR